MAVKSTATPEKRDALVTDKIAAFERIRVEFENCFAFVEAVHGQRRFAMFSVTDSVRYLHALWVCECKDRLLSVPRTTKRYEGKRCLDLLRDWQQSETAGVVTFLQRKLDMVDFARLTRERQEAVRQGDGALARRLAHGRAVLLNRGFNLQCALDAIFALDDAALEAQVREACAAHGHLPDEIAGQLSLLNTPVYSYAPHPLLAQRNMRVMNLLGVRVTDLPEDAPGGRTSAVSIPNMPLPPYADEVIVGELDLSGMQHNNPWHFELPNPPQTVDAPDAQAPAPPPG